MVKHHDTVARDRAGDRNDDGGAVIESRLRFNFHGGGWMKFQERVAQQGIERGMFASFVFQLGSGRADQSGDRVQERSQLSPLAGVFGFQSSHGV